ncbi:MAG: hypothetical protein AAF411_28805 [Myxococcota bacterium]
MLWLRFFKLLGAFVFFAGTLAAIMPGLPFAMRRRFTFAVAAPGFGLSWALGFVLVSTQRHSVLSAWILGALVSSMVSLQALLYLAGKEERRGPVARPLAVLGLLITLVLMVWRPT